MGGGSCLTLLLMASSNYHNNFCIQSGVMYENEQLKAENSKLRETLNKAYDFMKQFVVDGRNLLERFLESIGQVVEKVRDGFRR